MGSMGCTMLAGTCAAPERRHARAAGLLRCSGGGQLWGDTAVGMISRATTRGLWRRLNALLLHRPATLRARLTAVGCLGALVSVGVLLVAFNLALDQSVN